MPLQQGWSTAHDADCSTTCMLCGPQAVEHQRCGSCQDLLDIRTSIQEYRLPHAAKEDCCYEANRDNDNVAQACAHPQSGHVLTEVRCSIKIATCNSCQAGRGCPRLSKVPGQLLCAVRNRSNRVLRDRAYECRAVGNVEFPVCLRRNRQRGRSEAPSIDSCIQLELPAAEGCFLPGE